MSAGDNCRFVKDDHGRTLVRHGNDCDVYRAGVITNPATGDIIEPERLRLVKS